MRASSSSGKGFVNLCASIALSVFPYRVPPAKLPALALVLLTPVLFFTLLVASSLLSFQPDETLASSLWRDAISAPLHPAASASSDFPSSGGASLPLYHLSKRGGGKTSRGAHSHPALSSAEQALHHLHGLGQETDPVEAFLAEGGQVRVVLLYPSIRYISVIAPYLKRAARRAYSPTFDPTRLLSAVRVLVPRAFDGPLGDAGSVPPGVLMEHMLRLFGAPGHHRESRSGNAANLNIEASFGPSSNEPTCESFSDLVGGAGFISVVLDPATVYMSEMTIYYLVRALLQDESIDIAAANVINGEGAGALHSAQGAFDAASAYTQMRFEEQTELSRTTKLSSLAAFKEIPSPPFDFNSSSKTGLPPYAYLQHLYFLRHHHHSTLSKAYVHPDLDLKPAPSLSSETPLGSLHGLSFHRAFAFRGADMKRRLILDLDQCENDVAATAAEEEVDPRPVAETPVLYRYIFKAARRVVRVGRALTVLFAQRTQLLAFDTQAMHLLSQQQASGQIAGADAPRLSPDSAPSAVLFSPSIPQEAGCEEEAKLLDRFAVRPERVAHRGDGVRGPVAAMDASVLALWRHPLGLPWPPPQRGSEAAAINAEADFAISSYLAADGSSGFALCDAVTRRVSLPGASVKCGGTGEESAQHGELHPSVFGCPGWLEDRVLPKYRLLASSLLDTSATRDREATNHN
jgi:hypothetical protein